MHTHSHTLHTHSVKQTFRLTHIDEGTQTPSESHPLRHTHTNPLTQTETSDTHSHDDIYLTKCNKHTHETLQEGGHPITKSRFFLFHAFTQYRKNLIEQVMTIADLRFFEKIFQNFSKCRARMTYSW